MATKKYAATIEFGAAISSSFNTVLGATKKKVDELGKAMAKTKGAEGVALGLFNGRRRLSEAFDVKDSLQSQLEHLKSDHWEANTPGGKKKIKEVEKLSKAATAEYIKQRKAVADLTAQARAAGIDVTKLADETKRLGDELGALDKQRSGLLSVQANTKRVGDTIEKLKSGVGRVGEAFERDFGRAAKVLGLVTAGATAAGFAVYKITRSFVDSGNEVLNLASSLNMTTAALQTWQFAAKKAGIPEDAFRSGISQYQRSMEDGSKGTVEALTKLNLSYTRMKKLPVAQQLLVIAKAFKEYKGQANLAALSQALLGEAGTRMLPILKKGAEGMEELYAEVKKTGYILDNEMKANVEDGTAAFGEMGASLTGVSNIIGSELEPTFATAARTITQFLADHNADIRKWAYEAGIAFYNVVIPAVVDFTDKLPELWKSLKQTATEVWNGIGAVKDFVGGWDRLGAIILGLNFAPTIAAMFSLAGALWKASAASWALAGPWPLIALAVGAAAAWIIWHWDEISEKLIEWKHKLSEVMDEAGAKIMGALKPAFDWIGAQFDRMAAVLNGFLDKISAGTAAVRGFFAGASMPEIGKSGFQPSGASIAGGAILVPPQMMSTNSGGSKTQNNNFNISVHAPGANGAEIANGIRGEVQRKPLYDMQSVLAPN